MILELLTCTILVCYPGAPCYTIQGDLPKQMVKNTVRENLKKGAKVTTKCKKKSGTEHSQ